jgi:PAS domain S-box-containing protein
MPDCKNFVRPESDRCPDSHSDLERRLRKQQEFARRLIDFFPDLIVALDNGGRCTFVGTRSLDLLGFASDELVGSLFIDRVAPQDRLEFESLRDSRRASSGSAVSPVELFLETKGGSARLFRVTAGALLDDSGNAEGLIISLRDVTESKRIEQQLAQAERLAAMGRMVAGAAHELNNPLTAVLGVTELLKDSIKDQSLQRHLDLAHGQARRAAQIVQGLLTFSRPSQPRKFRMQLADVIERSLQFYERSLRASNIKVEFVRPPDAAPVLGDAGQLTQVVLNIVANAEHAIREIRDHGTILIRLSRRDDRIIATFQDDGGGIRPDVLPKIFDPFFTTKRPGQGTGLGLSISAAILREHEGTIEARPVSSGGTIVSVSLPWARGEESTPAASIFSNAAAAPAGSLSGCSLLIVDDEEGIRELVRDGMSSRVARVDTASTGEEALCLIESRGYDFVLCDRNLKSMVPSALTGQELFARIDRASVAADRAPIFVFMTGDLADELTLEDARGRKVRALQKPFTVSALAGLLTEILAERQPARIS